MEIPKAWTFEDDAVAAAFEEHVREQLPFYDMMTRAVVHVVAHYLPRGGKMLDVGASTGNVGRACAELIASRGAVLSSYEPSAEMRAKWRGPGSLDPQSAEEIEWPDHDVSTFVLTAMFVPVALRRDALAKAYAALRDGGVMIVVDRTPPVRGYPASVFWRLTLAEKVRAGAPKDQVLEKELSLIGVQRPLSLHDLPGNPVEFFRFGDFAGWLIEKGSD